MALPLVPTALVAARYAAVGLAAYAAWRAASPARRDQRAEDALDDLPEGTGLHRDADGTRGTLRWTRTLRAGTAGPGVEIDLAALARLRLRRV
ncbi:hypothetical protein DKT77_20325 [Meridianimarinicoccus roseus]|jgi:hypothetical protein|uniref:Uncharacterized protein n=1 Tax=Meridianimarinicoccus roseus TaxID=2072018 RepID=A0A2V2L707_9RHOB|nr:hypothetical protein [Meridianimarinicoccus roseus]PWR00875.1 hypothetical protein DKT77_20325 [Meridianimarinicoccus roseus]